MFYQLATNLIKKFEGLSLSSYRCPAGKLTIGYGHTKYVIENMKITTEMAQKLLEEDTVDAFLALTNCCPNLSLTDTQIAALLSFIFNVGETQFANSTLAKKLNKNELNEIPTELAKWTYVNHKVSQGLVNRRNEEIKMWNGEINNEILDNP